VTSMTYRPWEYKDVIVLPAGRNSSGIRWTANARLGVTLRADTKASMRELITAAKAKGRG
jgi:hypothetical protein